MDNISELIENTNDKIGSVALDTVGEVLQKYSGYRYRNGESKNAYEARKTRMLGMLPVSYTHLDVYKRQLQRQALKRLQKVLKM